MPRDLLIEKVPLTRKHASTSHVEHVQFQPSSHPLTPGEQQKRTFPSEAETLTMFMIGLLLLLHNSARLATPIRLLITSSKPQPQAPL